MARVGAFMEVAVAFLRTRWWLAAVMMLAAGLAAAGTLLCNRSASPLGTVPVTRALPGGAGTLSVTAQWTRPNAPGQGLTLGGLSARFSTCHRGWFLDLKQYCVALANPFFKVLGVTPSGGTVFRLTTRVVEDNFAHGHRTGWIVPIDRRVGRLYRLAASCDLIVQLWAIDTRTAEPHKVGEIRD